MSRIRRHRFRRGFFSADVIGAIILVSITAVLLAAAVHHTQRGSARLADSRAAVNLAEQTLIALQAGLTVPKAPEGAKVQIEMSDAPGAADGLAWATVTAQVNGRSASLTGLVKADALEKQRGGKS
jgi:hypothetical protein